MSISIDANQIKDICDKANISYLGLFGSYARGDNREDSDIDLLVDFTDTKSYFELARVQESFESMLKKKVDLVLRANMKQNLRNYILKDLTTLYEKR